MPRNPSSDLFHLVEKLSPEERKYVRRYISRHARSDLKNPLELFNALSEMRGKVYDEELLQKKGREEGKSFVNNLSAEKNNLMNRVLEGMRVRRARLDPVMNAHRTLEDAQYLLEMGLEKKGYKTLMQAKKKAKANHLDRLTLAVLEIERKQMRYAFGKRLEENLAELREEKQRILERLVLVNLLRDLSDRLFFLSRSQKKSSSGQILNECKAIVQGTVLGRGVSDVEGKGPEAMGLFHFCMAQVRQLQGDWAAAQFHYQEQVVNFVKHPAYCHRENRTYRLALANALQAGHEVKRYNDYPNNLRLLEAEPLKTKRDHIENFQTVTFLKFLWKINTLDFEAAYRMVPEIWKTREKLSGQLTPSIELSFIYNVIVFYFIADCTSQKRAAERRVPWIGEWLKLLLEYKNGQARQDLIRFMRVLEVILLYESEGAGGSLFDSRFASIRRKLGKDLTPFEHEVLKALSKLAKALDEDRRAIFVQLVKALQELPDQKVRGFQEILLWASGHAFGESRANLLQKMVNLKN